MSVEYLRVDPSVVGADCAADGESASAVLRGQLADLELQFDTAKDAAERARLLLEMGWLQLELQQREAAWDGAEQAFRVYAEAADWERAVQACDIMFRADQPQSLVALGHAVWLGVTYPIDPELTVSVLQHVVEDTPDDSDGGAVAAAAAHYLADLRSEGKLRDRLTFFTNQLLGQVARRHGKVAEQAQFELWVQRLELDQPEKFLPRLGKVVDALVGNRWWIDRDALRAQLPE